MPSDERHPDADLRTKAALAALPERDDWPFLVRPMFSTTCSDHVSVAYSLRPVHFAASFKTVEWDWEAWLVKFESLLSTLDGLTAIVHLETELVGNHTYKWQRKPANVGNWPPEWEFEGGPRSFRPDAA